MRMHEGQVDLSTEVVAGLVTDQFPEWRDRAVVRVRSRGTVNALFRLGADLVLRFPLVPSRTTGHRAKLSNEQRHARMIATRVPVEVPKPVALGEPGPGYDGPWSVYRWIEGATADGEAVADQVRLANDLAGFVRALHAVDTDGRTWNGRRRGGPLAAFDESVRSALAASAEWVDPALLGPAWDRCLGAQTPTASTWLHADLMPGNLVLRRGRLAAVIDCGGGDVGDPAVDLMPAWNLFDHFGRAAYRTALGADEAAWERGRGWAIVQAIVALPYYATTNAYMAALARRTLAAVLAS